MALLEHLVPCLGFFLFVCFSCLIILSSTVGGWKLEGTYHVIFPLGFQVHLLKSYMAWVLLISSLADLITKFCVWIMMNHCQA